MVAWKQQIRIRGRLCVRHCLRQEESFGTTERTTWSKINTCTYFRFRERKSTGVSVWVKHLKLRNMTKKNVYGLGAYYYYYDSDGTLAADLIPNAVFFLRGFENNRLVAENLMFFQFDSIHSRNKLLYINFYFYFDLFFILIWLRLRQYPYGNWYLRFCFPGKLQAWTRSGTCTILLLNVIYWSSQPVLSYSYRYYCGAIHKHRGTLSWPHHGRDR